MSYLEFYEMNVEPFSNAPISRFYYNSAPHSKALVRLMYAIDSMKGLAVLIGEIGSGKTTLARRLLDSLPEDQYEAALLVIIHSGVDPLWLLRRIASQLGVEDPAQERLNLLGQVYQRLIEIHESGRRAVVLIDEAQMLASQEVMEEFRGLLNLELPEKKLLNIVLFGLPDLEDHLALDPPLCQRIAVKYRLDALDARMTEDYIKHRLRLAGAKRMLFTKEATDVVFDFSFGIPRLINTISDNSLFEGFVMKAHLIDAPLVRNVCADLGLVDGKQEGRAAQRVRGGTRVTDYMVTPGYSNPAPAKPQPQPFSGKSQGFLSQNLSGANTPHTKIPPPPSWPQNKQDRLPPPKVEAAWEESEKDDVMDSMANKQPLIEEIDGILDNLIDKIK